MRSDAQLTAMADRFSGLSVRYRRGGSNTFSIGETSEILTVPEYNRLQHLKRITAGGTLCTVEGYDAYEAAREAQNQRNIRENLDYWRGVMGNPTDENLYKFAGWTRTSEWSDKR